VVRVGATSTILAQEAHTELDSHADQSTVGAGALIVEHLPKATSVMGWDPTAGSVSGYQIVNAAVAYDDPHDGTTKILRINQAILVPGRQNNLLSTMQVATSRVNVYPTPAYLDPRPHEDSHSIVFETPEHFKIPLTLRGSSSGFPTRKPTLAEYENADVIYHLTTEDIEWDPV